MLDKNKGFLKKFTITCNYTDNIPSAATSSRTHKKIIISDFIQIFSGLHPGVSEIEINIWCNILAVLFYIFVFAQNREGENLRSIKDT